MNIWEYARRLAESPQLNAGKHSKAPKLQPEQEKVVREYAQEIVHAYPSLDGIEQLENLLRNMLRASEAAEGESPAEIEA